MSGIAGFWNLDDAPADLAIARAMASALAHRGPDGVAMRVEGAHAIAHLHNWSTEEEHGEEQPLVGPSGAILAIDGRVDNRNELRGALALPADATDAQFALAAFDRWGDGFAERLEGEFAVAVAEPAARRVRLLRDAIGLRPIYYVRTDRLFAFASEIKALLAHPAVAVRPDPEGLADYLMVGARPLDRQDITCFAGISAVVPSHLLVVTPDGVSTRRYWDFVRDRRIQLGSVEEYAEAFAAHFRNAVRRRARGTRPIAVSVSGGLDSSSIFCQAEVLRRARDVNCEAVAGISFTGDEGGDADERAFLCAIEREYGVAIERFPMNGLTGIVGGAAEQVRAVEAPFLDYMWGVTRELHGRAATRGARILFSGQWGDQVLFSTGYLVDLFNGFAWNRIRQHTREYARYFGEGEARTLLRRLPGDIVRHHLPRQLVAPLKWVKRRALGEHRQKQWFSNTFLRAALRFADRPASVGSGFHSAHARSIYLEARSKYHVQCMEWHNKIGALRGLDVALPLLDRDLLAFLMAVPGEIQNNAGVPRALLREGMRGVLPDAVRARRWKADFSGVVNRGVADDAAAIGETLTREARVVQCGFVDPNRLRREVSRLVDALGGAECTASWDLADLYGLEVWLQVFLSPS